MSFLILVCMVIPGALGLCVGGFLVPEVAIVAYALAAAGGFVGLSSLGVALTSSLKGSGPLGLSALSLCVLAVSACLALGTFVGTALS